jgi:hypothetical protein
MNVLHIKLIRFQINIQQNIFSKEMYIQLNGLLILLHKESSWKKSAISLLIIKMKREKELSLVN